MDLKEEKELVKNAQRDPEAFGVLYDQYYKQIFNYILKRTGDVATAQDITSETFIKVLQKMPSFQWRNVPFVAWIYKITSNEISTYFRKGKYRPVSLEQLFETSHFEPSIDENAHTELVEAQEIIAQHGEYLEMHGLIKTLPQRFQQIIVLRYFENKKFEEISVILNVKAGAIKTMLSRGLRKLEKLIAAQQTQNNGNMSPNNVTLSSESR